MAIIVKNEGNDRRYDPDVYEFLRQMTLRRVGESPKDFEVTVDWQRRYMLDGASTGKVAVDLSATLPLTDDELAQLMALLYTARERQLGDVAASA